MSKVWVVLLREYLVNVRRPAFWLVTLGLPLLFAILGLLGVGLIFAVGYFGAREEKPQARHMGIVDEAGIIDFSVLNPDTAGGGSSDLDLDWLKSLELTPGLESLLEGQVRKAKVVTDPARFLAFPSWQEGLDALDRNELVGLIELSPTYTADFKSRLMWLDQPRHSLGNKLNAHLRRQILRSQFDEDQIEAILNPLEKAQIEILKAPSDAAESEPEWFEDFKVKQFLLPFLFMMTMMMVIITALDRLLRGMVEEKQNRVIEVLLSSVSAEQLMAGKVIGLGLLGLTQLAIWMLLLFIPTSFVFVFIHIQLLDILIFLAYFLLGYFLLASLCLGLGSLGRNLQEASQWSMICFLLALSPMFMLSFFLNNPDGGLAKFFTFFPFSSPLVTLFRYGTAAIEPWEIGISLVILALTIVLVLRVSAKLFRLGILLTGQAPTPARIWRHFRDT